MIPLDPEGPLRVTRTLKAARERVFDAFVVPQLRKQWWGATAGDRCTLCDIDARIGGSYRINMLRAEGEFIVTGTFREIIRPEKLVFTWTWEQPAGGGGESLVTVLFQSIDPSTTELTILHERLATPALRDLHAEGWAGCLQSLVKFAETAADEPGYR